MGYLTYKEISKILEFSSNNQNTDDTMSKKKPNSLPVLSSLEFIEFMFLKYAIWGRDYCYSKQDLTILYIFLDMKERIKY